MTPEQKQAVVDAALKAWVDAPGTPLSMQAAIVAALRELEKHYAGIPHVGSISTCIDKIADDLESP